ncbi:MAG: ribosomal protein S18-alanine N-acetyltransferase [Actinomycetales bacterium]
MRWWDITGLEPLERALFPHDTWPAEAFWAELAMADRRVYLVAEAEDGSVLGYAGLSCPVAARGGDAEIMTVAVDPAARGGGVGTALVEALRDEAGRRGAGRLLLEVRADNAAALALYRRAGFEQIATRPSYYAAGPETGAVDALVLRLRLPAPDTVPR